MAVVGEGWADAGRRRELVAGAGAVLIDCVEEDRGGVRPAGLASRERVSDVVVVGFWMEGFARDGVDALVGPRSFDT